MVALVMIGFSVGVVVGSAIVGLSSVENRPVYAALRVQPDTRISSVSRRVAYGLDRIEHRPEFLHQGFIPLRRDLNRRLIRHFSPARPQSVVDP
jgi:hypothetical protein